MSLPENAGGEEPTAVIDAVSDDTKKEDDGTTKLQHMMLQGTDGVGPGGQAPKPASSRDDKVDEQEQPKVPVKTTQDDDNDDNNNPIKDSGVPVDASGTPLYDPADIIKEPNELDCLFGRGKPFQMHTGNKRFLTIIDRFKARYLNAKRGDKHPITADLVRIVKMNDQGGPPIRFLKRICDIKADAATAALEAVKNETNSGLRIKKIDSSERPKACKNINCGCGWVEVDNNAAMIKVSHTLRSRWRRVEAGLEPITGRQSYSSSHTHPFGNDMGGGGGPGLGPGVNLGPMNGPGPGPGHGVGPGGDFYGHHGYGNPDFVQNGRKRRPDDNAQLEIELMREEMQMQEERHMASQLERSARLREMQVMQMRETLAKSGGVHPGQRPGGTMPPGADRPFPPYSNGPRIGPHSMMHSPMGGLGNPMMSGMPHGYQYDGHGGMGGGGGGGGGYMPPQHMGGMPHPPLGQNPGFGPSYLGGPGPSMYGGLPGGSGHGMSPRDMYARSLPNAPSNSSPGGGSGPRQSQGQAQSQGRGQTQDQGHTQGQSQGQCKREAQGDTGPARGGGGSGSDVGGAVPEDTETQRPNANEMPKNDSQAGETTRLL